MRLCGQKYVKMIPEKVENAVGRNEEIAPGTTLITSRELLGWRDPFRGPPGAHFDLIRGARGPYFVPLQAAPTS